MRSVLLVAGAALACLGGVCTAQAKTSVGIGADYSTGKYGSDIVTEIFSVPVSVKHRRGNWTLKASLPWLRVSGDPNVLPTLGPVDNLNPLGRGRIGLLEPSPVPEESGTASGVGDLTLGATYTVPTRGKLGLDLGVKAKVATADPDKGLGTGANDYGATLDVYREVAGTTVFGGVGHTLLGNSEFIDVDSVTSANLGLSRKLGRASVGAMFEHRTATVSTQDSRRDLVGFVALPTSGARKLQVYASRGLTDSSPDWGVGVAFSTGE